MTSSSLWSTGIITYPWYIGKERLVIISLIIIKLSRKMRHYHLNMNIAIRCSGHTVTSYVTLSTSNVYTRGQFWLSDIVVACVCPSVHQSNRPSVAEFVRAITHCPFMLGSPNLGHRYTRPWLRSLLFWGWLTLTFKVKFNFEVWDCEFSAP